MFDAVFVRKPMRKTGFLVIGIGNRNRGDDAIGPLVAERVSGLEAMEKAGVEVRVHSGEGASLMELWRGARRVVIIDAMKSGAGAGLIKRFDAGRERVASGVFRYSSHLFSLAEAVELSRALGRMPETMIIYGVEGRNFSFGAPMTPEVAAALSEVAARAAEEFACGGMETKTESTSPGERGSAGDRTGKKPCTKCRCAKA